MRQSQSSLGSAPSSPGLHRVGGRARRAGTSAKTASRPCIAFRADAYVAPSLHHPLAVDATASETDDVPRLRFIPVRYLSEPKEGEANASARSF